MISRRGLLHSALAAQLAQAQDGKNPRSWPASPRRTDGGAMPNVLWFCTDQQRYDTIEGLNNEHVRTPNLRRFMGECFGFVVRYSSKYLLDAGSIVHHLVPWNGLLLYYWNIQQGNSPYG